jgi:hypothetical protein
MNMTGALQLLSENRLQNIQAVHDQLKNMYPDSTSKEINDVVKEIEEADPYKDKRLAGLLLSVYLSGSNLSSYKEKIKTMKKIISEMDHHPRPKNSDRNTEYERLLMLKKTIIEGGKDNIDLFNKIGLKYISIDNYDDGDEKPIKVVEKGNYKYKFYKITSSTNLNTPLFENASSYCITTRAYVNSSTYGKKPYYVVFRYKKNSGIPRQQVAITPYHGVQITGSKNEGEAPEEEIEPIRKEINELINVTPKDAIEEVDNVEDLYSFIYEGFGKDSSKFPQWIIDYMVRNPEYASEISGYSNFPNGMWSDYPEIEKSIGNSEFWMNYAESENFLWSDIGYPEVEDKHIKTADDLVKYAEIYKGYQKPICKSRNMKEPHLELLLKDDAKNAFLYAEIFKKKYRNGYAGMGMPEIEDAFNKSGDDLYFSIRYADEIIGKPWALHGRKDIDDKLLKSNYSQEYIEKMKEIYFEIKDGVWT